MNQYRVAYCVPHRPELLALDVLARDQLMARATALLMLRSASAICEEYSVASIVDVHLTTGKEPAHGENHN